jgi:hypothetical protein
MNRLTISIRRGKPQASMRIAPQLLAKLVTLDLPVAVRGRSWGVNALDVRICGRCIAPQRTDARWSAAGLPMSQDRKP